jgi:hypothetical protein
MANSDEGRIDGINNTVAHSTVPSSAGEPVRLLADVYIVERLVQMVRVTHSFELHLMA